MVSFAPAHPPSKAGNPGRLSFTDGKTKVQQVLQQERKLGPSPGTWTPQLGADPWPCYLPIACNSLPPNPDIPVQLPCHCHINSNSGHVRLLLTTLLVTSHCLQDQVGIPQPAFKALPSVAPTGLSSPASQAVSALPSIKMILFFYTCKTYIYQSPFKQNI